MSVMSVNCANITLSEKTVWELISELCIRKQDHISVTFVVWHFLPGETKSNIWRNITKKNFGQKFAKFGPKIVLKKCYRFQTSKYWPIWPKMCAKLGKNVFEEIRKLSEAFKNWPLSGQTEAKLDKSWAKIGYGSCASEKDIKTLAKNCPNLTKNHKLLHSNCILPSKYMCLCLSISKLCHT